MRDVQPKLHRKHTHQDSVQKKQHSIASGPRRHWSLHTLLGKTQSRQLQVYLVARTPISRSMVRNFYSAPMKGSI